MSRPRSTLIQQPLNHGKTPLEHFKAAYDFKSVNEDILGRLMPPTCLFAFPSISQELSTMQQTALVGGTAPFKKTLHKGRMETKNILKKYGKSQQRPGEHRTRPSVSTLLTWWQIKQEELPLQSRTFLSSYTVTDNTIQLKNIHKRQLKARVSFTMKQHLRALLLTETHRVSKVNCYLLRRYSLPLFCCIKQQPLLW